MPPIPAWIQAVFIKVLKPWKYAHSKDDAMVHPVYLHSPTICSPQPLVEYYKCKELSPRVANLGKTPNLPPMLTKQNSPPYCYTARRNPQAEAGPAAGSQSPEGLRGRPQPSDARQPGREEKTLSDCAPCRYVLPSADLGDTFEKCHALTRQFDLIT